MRRWIFSSAAALLVAAYWLLAESPATYPRQTILVRGAQIFIGNSTEFSRGDLLIRDGRIVPAGEFKADATTRILDGGRLFVTPGLVDGHTHMMRAGLCSGDEGVGWENVRQIPMNFDVALSYGETTVVDLGGPLYGSVALRDRLQSEVEAGKDWPRYIVAGPILTAPEGYPFDWLDPNLAEELVVAIGLDSSDHARTTVRRIKNAGANLVKIAAMELAYNERPLKIMDQDVFSAAVDEAKKQGLRVFVHAHSPEGYRRALTAGAPVIAHSSFLPLPEEIVRQAARNRVIVIPTLWVFAAFGEALENSGLVAELQPQVLPHFYGRLLDFDRRMKLPGNDIPGDFLPGLKKSRLETAMATARQNLYELWKAGVELGFGTDTSFCYGLHGSAGREMLEMQKAGLPAGVVLQAATRGSARALGRDDLGGLTPGVLADALILTEDPLADLGTVARPAAVIRDGRIVRCDSGKLVDFCPAGARSGPLIPGVLKTLGIGWELLRSIYL
ncbi:MAG: amidohydrolase family protein [Nitrospirae bacterium]|nr:amidohydrolase family protein [Nitrospirota bacterium]